MKIDWRISAITAGSAFLLSVLIGVIGNVSFGVLILRAATAAALFGGGAIGVTIVIDRYLPELRRASAAPVPSATGSTVDIVVEGDDDLETLSDGLDASDEERTELDDGVEELSANDADEAPEEVDESGDEDGISTVASDSEAAEMEEIGSGDGLPNVDAMADSFTEVPLGEDPGVDSGDSGEDPALMARAIRTILKREE